jgi:Ankyrin repeats (3 copies)
MDLHEAARSGDVARVKELLDQGADVDARDRWDNTPLLLACFSEVHHPEVVALLRERGADPHRRNIHWDTPRTQAHERYLMSGFDPLGDLPAPELPETEASELTDEELEVTAAAVRAVVEGDEAALENMKAFDGGDPYEWMHQYGRWGDVHLVLPPGDPRTWTINVIRRDDDDWLAVDVDMWTREEGRSDLTLELELRRQADGSLRAEFHNLHVM